MDSGLGKDTQINAIREARRFATDKLMRVVPPHPMLAPEHGPLIAVRLSTLTRKSLGGLHNRSVRARAGRGRQPHPRLVCRR